MNQQNINNDEYATFSVITKQAIQPPPEKQQIQNSSKQ